MSPSNVISRGIFIAPLLDRKLAHNVDDVKHRCGNSLFRKRRHCIIRYATGNDVLAHITQIGADIQRKTMHGSSLGRSTRNTNSDCANLACLRSFCV